MRLLASTLLVCLLISCGEIDRGESPPPVVSSVCGNGRIDSGEACDRNDLNGASCASLGLGAGGLSCRADCKTYDRSQCGAAPTCGNGRVDAVEVCEGAELVGQSCQTVGLGSGTLGCLPNCNGFNTVGCTMPMMMMNPTQRCGNGTIEGTEVCDGGNLGGATCGSLGYTGGSLACGTDCTMRVTTGCTGTCTPSCGARVCGPDPSCGTSCGTCPTGSCNAAGQCEAGPTGSPRILTFNTNTNLYRGSGNLVFSAVLTDPDGVDDLIGGQLFSSNNNAYGAFATSAQEGAYSLSLGWQDLHAVEPLNGPPAGVMRSFRAQFFDSDGNMATAMTSVTVRCNDDESSLCNGVCQDLTSNWNQCGQCNRNCDNVTPPSSFQGETDRRCIEGRCNYRSFGKDVTPVLQSCGAFCASHGMVCNEAEYQGVPNGVLIAGIAQYDCTSAPIATCATVPPATAPNDPACSFIGKMCFCGL